MATKVIRKYKNKDVEMLTAAAIITGNAIANKPFLESKRSTWKDPFFDDFLIEIKITTDTFLGKDAAKQLRDATQVVLALQTQAIIDLAEFKVQVEQDFKNTPTLRDEILNQLGFQAHYKAVQKGDQEALVNLLFRFKTNMTPELTTEIVEKGTAQATIDNILGYATTLQTANVSQESFKGFRTEITEEAIIAFNTIYDKLISIAKIASNFFKTDKSKQQLFSYAKVVANLNNK